MKKITCCAKREKKITCHKEKSHPPLHISKLMVRPLEEYTTHSNTDFSIVQDTFCQSHFCTLFVNHIFVEDNN